MILKLTPMLKYFLIVAIVCLIILILPGVILAHNDKVQDSNIEIRFEYSPSALTTDPKDTESVFLTIRGDGRAEALRYGAYQPTIITVYRGVLPRADVEKIVAKVQGVISESARHRRYASGVQDTDVFHLSILPCNDLITKQQVIDYWAVIESSGGARIVIEQLRELWKRLKEINPAYAYVRSEPIENEAFRKLGRDPQFISIQKFPRKLRPIILKALKRPLSFNSISKKQFNQLLAFTSTQYFTVVDGNSGFSLTLHLSLRHSRKPLQERLRNDTSTYASKEILFVSSPYSGQHHGSTRNRNCRRWHIRCNKWDI